MAPMASSSYHSWLSLYGSSSSEAAQAAAMADLFTLKCEAGFLVGGLQDGEAEIAPIRVICTLIAASAASAWFSQRRLIKMLLLFFCHWLSGLVYLLALMSKATMIMVCWADDNLEGVIKTLTFLELVASNMLALTNLAICVNLALIVMSYRASPFERPRPSSPMLVMLSLIVSFTFAFLSLPYWETMILTATTFWPTNTDESNDDWINISMFLLEFIVGASMFLIVAWLALFRTKEIRECWKIHARIRYYFGLTLIGTVVNLTLGIVGFDFVFQNRIGVLQIVLTWAFRYIHIALDTIVLYAVLAPRRLDPRVSVSVDTSSGGRREAAAAGHCAPKMRFDSSNESISPENNLRSLPRLPAAI